MELNRELLQLQQAYAIIHTYGEMIQEGLRAEDGSVSVRKMDALPIKLGGVNDFSSGYFYDSFFDFIKKSAGGTWEAAYPVGGFYEDAAAFLDAPGYPTRFFAIAPSGRDAKPAGAYLVGYARGYYGRVGDLPMRMKAYAEQHNLVLAGPVYEIYLHDEISVADPDQYLIQASVPVKKPQARRR
jgi:hypothetical protein